jgi:thiamine biosynthesis lipoprotein
MFRSFCLLSFSLLIGCGDGVEDNSKLVSLTGKALGTTWTVKILSFQQIDENELRTAITARIEESEKIFSHWRPDCELYQFNQTLTTSPVLLHPQLHALLKHAQWMHRQTDGAFDPTIAPLVNIWGFGPASGNRSAIPTGVEIDRALLQTGLEKLKILPKDKVRKKRPDLQIDLSASAKGEIIDLVCTHLDSWDFTNYLVEIGGEIRVRGKGKADQGWLVGLEDGTQPNKGGVSTLTLRDYAVATSGTYRIQKPNPDSTKPASHLLDPRTGRPVEHDLVAVNVLAPTARDADAWATALMILGPEEAMKIAKQMNLAARFCVKDGNQTKHAFSPAYERLFPEK